MFDFQGRAKFDAWLARGKQIQPDEAAEAYVALVRRLGWPGLASSSSEDIALQPEESAGKGMVSVSTLASQSAASSFAYLLRDFCVLLKSVRADLVCMIGLLKAAWRSWKMVYETRAPTSTPETSLFVVCYSFL